MSDYVIGVMGNPNCGKTTLFNALTGTRQRVGNWPGVTVDRKSGEYTYLGKKIEVVDLPGIYSLSAASLDEEVARDYILFGTLESAAQEQEVAEVTFGAMVLLFGGKAGAFAYLLFILLYFPCVTARPTCIGPSL